MLDDITTPLRLLELFFDDELMTLLLAMPSCTVTERKQKLVLKLLMKIFAFFKHATV